MGKFLVCSDYGQGGIWLYVEGESEESVSLTYPELLVFADAPPWWNAEFERAARSIDPAQSPFKEILESVRKK